MFRSCRNWFRCFSQMKIIKLELFQNALKIIMVGTENQFERTLKNVVVNSESAFWDILWKAIILGFVPRSFGMTWMDRKVVEPPKRAANFVGAIGGPHEASFHHLVLHLPPHFALMCDIKHGHIGYLWRHTTPWFSYK